MINEMNEALKDRNNGIIQRIEQAHLTVRVTSARATYLDLTTQDGTPFAGVNNSNLRFSTYEITARWDGIIHKNGTTVFRIVWDHETGTLREARIVRTDALITDIDWLGLACALISIILASRPS